jgi:hypothetical protein
LIRINSKITLLNLIKPKEMSSNHGKYDFVVGDGTALKEYRKRNASGAMYDDPRVAIAVGRFDEVVALAEA